MGPCLSTLQQAHRAQRVLFHGGYNKMKQSTHAWHTWLATILQYPPVLQQLGVFFLGLGNVLSSKRLKMSDNTLQACTCYKTNQKFAHYAETKISNKKRSAAAALLDLTEFESAPKS
jgi:hypothetical protein